MEHATSLMAFDVPSHQTNASYMWGQSKGRCFQTRMIPHNQDTTQSRGGTNKRIIIIWTCAPIPLYHSVPVCAPLGFVCCLGALVLAGENLKEIVNSTHSLKSIRGICLKLNWHWKWVLERRDLLSVGAAGAFSLPRNWPYSVEWVRGKEYGLNVVSINFYLIMCLVMCKYLLPEA